MRNRTNLLAPLVVMITALLINMLPLDWMKGVAFMLGCLAYIIYILSLPKEDDSIPHFDLKAKDRFKKIYKTTVKRWAFEKFIFDYIFSLGRSISYSPKDRIGYLYKKVIFFTVIIMALGFLFFFITAVWVSILLTIIGGICWLLIFLYMVGRIRNTIQLATLAKELELTLSTVMYYAEKLNLQ